MLGRVLVLALEVCARLLTFGFRQLGVGLKFRQLIRTVAKQLQASYRACHGGTSRRLAA